MKQKYITAGVCDQISLLTQMMIWQLAASLPVTKDYLQVFTLTPGIVNSRDVQLLKQNQEIPEYERICTYYCENPLSLKLFMIDDGAYITLMLASEY